MGLEIAFKEPLCCHVPSALSENGRYKYELLKEEEFAVKMSAVTRRRMRGWGLKPGDVRHNANGLVNWHWSHEKACTVKVRHGYGWDGPSGLTWDRDENMFGSLLHDALYGMMRDGLLPQTCRKWADRAMMNVCKRRGMTWLVRAIYELTLGKFGGFAARTGADGYHYKGELYLQA